MKSLFVVAVCVLAGCVPLHNNDGTYAGSYGSSVTVSPDTRYSRDISCMVFSNGRSTSTADTAWDIQGSGLQIIEFEVSGGGYEDSFLSIGLEGDARVTVKPKIYVEEWLKSSPPQPASSILHFKIPPAAYPLAADATLFVKADRLLAAHTAKLRAYQWVGGDRQVHVEFPEGVANSAIPEEECLAGIAPKPSAGSPAKKPVDRGNGDMPLDDGAVDAYFARRTKGIAVDPDFSKQFGDYVKTGNPRPLVTFMPSLLSSGRRWSSEGTASGDREFSYVLETVLEEFRFEPVVMDVHKKMFIICLADSSKSFESCVLGVLDDLGDLMVAEDETITTDKNGNSSKLGGRKK
jgi:hypothetical protein